MPFAGSAQVTLRYTVPGPAPTSPTFSVPSIVYTASNAGFIDIPESTASATPFSVPFGAVAAAKGVLIQNNTSQELDVIVQGEADSVFRLPPGGICIPLLASTAGTVDPLTQVSVITTAVAAEDGNVAFVILGDEPTP